MLPKSSSLVSAYCPRCDRSFTASLKRDAIKKMDEHVKRAHPDMYPENEKDNT